MDLPFLSLNFSTAISKVTFRGVIAAAALASLAACCNDEADEKQPGVKAAAKQATVPPAADAATIVGVDSEGNTFVVKSNALPSATNTPGDAGNSRSAREKNNQTIAEPSIAGVAIATDTSSDNNDLEALTAAAVDQSMSARTSQQASEATVEVVAATTAVAETNPDRSETVIANGADGADVAFIVKGGEGNVDSGTDGDASNGTKAATAVAGTAVVATAITAEQEIVADDSSEDAKTTATPQPQGEDIPAASRSWMPIYDVTTANLVCDAILKKMSSKFDELGKTPLADASVESVLKQWNTLSAEFEDVEGPIYLQAYVSPNAAMRAAGEACIVRLGDFNTGLFQRSDLYERVKATSPTAAFDKTMRQDLLDAFDDNGIGFDADKQQRIKDLKKQINELSQEFSRNIRENEQKLTFSGDELSGLPDSYLQRVGVEDNSITVGFDYPEVIPFLNNASSEAARQRYTTAFSQRGTPQNLELLDQIMQLRKELATIFGKPSYAHLVTQRRMVQNPETVIEFLDKVENKVREVEVQDLAELTAMKAKLAGTELAATKVNQWDKSYLTEQTRQQRYAIDQEALRKYFPMPAVVDWGLWIASDLYGISFEPAKVPLWHEDVLYYDVTDTASGEFLGGIYLDLYPRDGKYKHAAAFGVRGGSKLANRRPNSVLVTNFDRKGLTHDELETFLHELGHVFHGVLTQSDYLAHAGTSVKRDFVEAPSQMFEEWARSEQTLKQITDFCDGCPALDNETIARLNDARNFGRGIFYSRQHLYASFDMRLAGDTPEPALPIWYEMEGATPIGALTDGQFPGTFAHIAGGYAAGYYGYMWSEVLAIDMLSAFGDNLMDKSVGKRFRDIILAQGGQQEPMALVSEFLGRKPSPEAFFAEITGQRNK